jgi:hypothetical protein
MTGPFAAAVMQAEFDFDVAGYHARPDVFALTVDPRPKPSVREI